MFNELSLKSSFESVKVLYIENILNKSLLIFFFSFSESYSTGKKKRKKYSYMYLKQPLDFSVDKSSIDWKSSEIMSGSQDYLTCHHCHESVEDLQLHMAIKHSQQFPYVCRICAKGYVSMSGLNHHLRAHKGRQFSCPVCDTRFVHKFHIKSHLKTAHRSAQCITCSGVFLIGEEYDTHILQCK